MAALGKLLRTTAFQLTLVYLFIFVVFAASLLGYFALNTRRLINEQITRMVTLPWIASGVLPKHVAQLANDYRGQESTRHGSPHRGD